MAGRRGSKEVRSRKQFERLRIREQETHERVLEAIALGRRQGLSPREACRRAGTSVRSLHKYGGSAITRSGNRLVFSDADRLYRRMRVLTPDGQKFVDLHGSRAASAVGEHWNAVDLYLKGKGSGPLRRFEGKRVGGYLFETDPGGLERALDRDEVRFEDIYGIAA